MKEVRYFFVPNANVEKELPTEEAIHALRVLRLKEGDEIFLMDGDGSFYQAEVSLATSKKCFYTIKQVLKQEPTWCGKIHLAIAPTKDIGRMEWMVEKATEIGFDEITFLNCKFSERKVLRTDRIEKIVISAVKQSHKAWKPVVNDMTSFCKFIDNHKCNGQKYICHCYSEIDRDDFFTLIDTVAHNAQDIKPSIGNDITVLVGPEGDFSIDEVRYAIDHGFKSVTLGNSRLRTETAGLSAVMMSQLARRVCPGGI